MSFKILLYSMPSCSWCQKTKAFLKEKKQEYIDFDVASDEKAREEMVKKSGQTGVPVMDIYGEIVIGFDEETLAKKLGIK